MWEVGKVGFPTFPKRGEKVVASLLVATKLFKRSQSTSTSRYPHFCKLECWILHYMHDLLVTYASYMTLYLIPYMILQILHDIAYDIIALAFLTHIHGILSNIIYDLIIVVWYHIWYHIWYHMILHIYHDIVYDIIVLCHSLSWTIPKLSYHIISSGMISYTIS